MQIDANFVNDYFDFVRGNDDETRLGPRRACAQGWVTMRAMKSALVITTALACVAGLPLVLYGGMEMIFVGIVCVLFCFLYTTRLSYIGMGDILVIVFFGLVPVTMTYYLEMPVTCKVLQRMPSWHRWRCRTGGGRVAHREQLPRHRQRPQSRQNHFGSLSWPFTFPTTLSIARHHRVPHGECWRSMAAYGLSCCLCLSVLS